MHVPVDHKDDSPEYRDQVWQAVSMRVGAELIPLDAAAKFEGLWDVAFDLFGTPAPAYQYRFLGDSDLEVTVATGDEETVTRGSWRIPRPGSISAGGATYHAAMTPDGRLVMFNGDQSLVLVASPRSAIN